MLVCDTSTQLRYSVCLCYNPNLWSKIIYYYTIQSSGNKKEQDLK